MTGTAYAEMLAIAAELTGRETVLRPPADKESLAQLEAVIGGPLGEQARALFSVFDGFDGRMPDDKTMVCLWSADAIHRAAAQHSRSAKGQLIGDHFLAAEHFRCDLRRDQSEVWWDERGTVAAASLLEFCRQVGRGTVAP